MCMQYVELGALYWLAYHEVQINEEGLKEEP